MTSQPNGEAPTKQGDDKHEKKGSESKKKTCFPRKEPNLQVDAEEVSYFRILFFDPTKRWLVFIGGFFALAGGSGFVIFSYVFGQIFNGFFTLQGTALQDRINLLCIVFVVVGVGSFICQYISTSCWVILGESIARKIRIEVFRALLRQEVGYFDQNQTGVLVSKLAADVTVIQNGVSEKVAQSLGNVAQVVGGIILAFVSSWKMTLVMLATSPILVAIGLVQTRVFSSSVKRTQKAYGKASNVASEAVSGVRTVYSFVAEEFMHNKFARLLRHVYKIGVKRAHITGLAGGFIWLFIFGVYALGFWYAGQLIVSQQMLPGDALTVFFSVMIGAMGLGQASTLLPEVAKAKGAAAGLFAILNREPLIQHNEHTGKRRKVLKGKIRMRHVKFAYPTRPDLVVLRNFHLKVNPGETIALVGPSGSGKSTVVQLLERFYDPLEGSVMIDGVDIREYDLKWLRQQIGLVSQEPILFEGTIEENIRFGKQDATFEEVENAAKLANAHSFIVNDLQGGYQCLVGEKGTQLSGGQKQRIAIARAILKDPKILLLDEATSALDAESEREVQQALDKLMRGRTTIVIAHRLTTVRNATCINVIVKGRNVERGTHRELLAKGGVYARLVRRQLDAGNTDDAPDNSTKEVFSQKPLNEEIARKDNDENEHRKDDDTRGALKS